MARYLLISDAGLRASDSENALLLWSIGRGLRALEHTVTLLTVADVDAAAKVPGLARRLRKVDVQLDGSAHALAFFEGQSGASDPSLVALGTPAGNTTTPADWLAAALQALQGDPLLSPDAAVAWGEPAAATLGHVQAAAKFFVLPEGRVQDPARASQGAIAAHAVLVPGAVAAHALQNDPSLDGLASDEPVVAFRTGADDPPHDPATDRTLPSPFSVAAPDGKQACRRALARRLGLAIEPHTLLLTVATGDAGEAAAHALASALRGDIAIVADAAGTDRRLVDRLRVLAIENPSRVALFHRSDGETAGSAARLLFGSSDAVLIARPQGVERTAGLALRYGALPIAPAQALAGGHVIDVDALSATGQAVLFPDADDATALDNAITRAAGLRRDANLWPQLVRNALASAPTWKQAAEVFDRLRERAEAGLEQRLAL